MSAVHDSSPPSTDELRRILMPRIPGLGVDEFQEHGYIAAAGIQLAADEQGQGQGGYQRGYW